MRTSCAFTLIELLVVIAIIALLVGILLPALGAARASSRLQLCQSNARSQGAVLAMYILDYQDSLPPRRLDWSTIDDDNNFVGRIYGINSFLAEYAGEPFNWPVGGGWPPITDIWRCPNVDEEEDFPYRFTHIGFLHHAPNRWLFPYAIVSEDQGIKNGFSDTLAGWDRRWPNDQWRRTFVVDHPTSIVTLMCNVGYFYKSHGHYEAREYYGTACEIVPRHDDCPDENESSHESIRRLSAVFLDGHGDSLPWTTSYWTDDRATYASNGPAYQLAAKEIEHLMWFVRQSDRTGGGGD